MSLPQPVRLFDSPRAPNPRRVRIFLAEKGLRLPTEQVDIMKGEQFAKSYTDRAGSFHVPALELSDGTVLTETIAICRYIEALCPEPNLFGRDAHEAAVIEMWQRRIEFQLLLPIAAVLRHGNPAMAVMERQCPEWAEANRPRVVEALHWLDQRLGQSAFVAGPRYSVADITAVVALDFMRTIRQLIPESCAALRAWSSGLHARSEMVA